MSSKKSTSKSKVNQPHRSYLYTVIGLILVFMSAIALIHTGFMGMLIVNSFRLFIGEVYPLGLFAIGAWGVLMVWRSQMVNIPIKKFIGGTLLLISLTLLLHLKEFTAQEPLSESIYQLTYTIFKNEFIMGQSQLSLGGGMLGAFLYQTINYLLGIHGSIVLSIFLFWIGLFLVVGIDISMIKKSIQHLGSQIGTLFQSANQSIQQARNDYRESFDRFEEVEERNSTVPSSPGSNTENPVKSHEVNSEYISQPTARSKKSFNLKDKIEQLFKSSDSQEQTIDYSYQYDLPMAIDRPTEFERYTSKDPLASTAKREREERQLKIQKELDLDYFDQINQSEAIRNLTQTSPMITTHGGEAISELSPNDGRTGAENKSRQVVVPDSSTVSEQVAPSDTSSLTSSKANSSSDLVEEQSEVNSVKDHSEQPAEHWQSKSTTVQNTTSDELDDLFEENSTNKTSISKHKPAKQPQSYQLPTKSLLNKIPPVDQSDEYKRINENIKKLEITFESFGVDAKVVKANLGPSVTKYEIEPAIGVKVSKIVSLADDIALALAARDVRIEAPIPGKSLIGIEVPNIQVSPVSFWEIIDPALKSNKILEVPLGRDISGSVCLADLSKMPHLLIAGATGSGKSVGMNVIITSLLMKAKPDEVKFLMIDPKKVELTLYNELPHLLAPVVTNPRKAAQALNNVVQEMEHRYELFASTGVRNIEGYNEAIAELNQTEGTGYQPLPKIVVFIDELADLMLVASNEVETAIIRLAQMARAAGIHMIIATQRPSVDVITGIIKANIPSRLAFAVSSGTDSRTILDANGAEKLLGRGDMLFQPMGRSKPLRVQGAYISDEEVERITDFIKAQSEPEYDENIVVTNESMELAEASSDELFDEVVELIQELETISISQLQRRFRIGYNRAARLIDDLESLGYVSAQDGSKPRQVLIN